MAFLFGRSKPQRQDLSRTLKDLLPKMWDAQSPPKVEEELARTLSQMKLILQGTQETETNPEAAHQLVQAIIAEDLLSPLTQTVHLFPFESRKDTQSILSHVFRFKPQDANSPIPPAIDHVVRHRPQVIVDLCRGYDQRESAMPCGVVLRELLKYQEVAVIIMYDEGPGTRFDFATIDYVAQASGRGVFWSFFPWIDRGAFEISADAFTTFREVITRHKQVTARFLQTNYDLFFQKYNFELMKSNSYVTKRQSIKLLGELLLDRSNYNVMIAYVADGEHLKLCMNLMRDDRKMVRYEAFHVFKVFVANPNKSFAVQKILINNRQKLLKFLPTFLDDRTDDEQFADEKSFLIRQIETMPDQPVELVGP